MKGQTENKEESKAYIPMLTSKERKQRKKNLHSEGKATGREEKARDTWKGKRHFGKEETERARVRDSERRREIMKAKNILGVICDLRRNTEMGDRRETENVKKEKAHT